MITKNFRLNALANQYATALYNHITATNGGEYFMVDAAGQQIRVELVGGVGGMRDLVNGCALEALKENYPQWESVGIALLSKCVNADGLTDTGREIWQSMVADMGATVAGGSHA
ncbi:hypothetical protein I4P08_14210 [Enterobacter hormaechei]|uniref:hypothetical protein n=1 Tax=Enterobacteriaceae TaxID=543 RepID=UPI0018C2553F|nr:MULTISPECIES: hypothetical protein [Enterobacteriaceae]MBG0687346.1 hypothetical protein [Enterobacter hormaechei]QXB20503.1 hypothetical protein I6L76_14905 [Lelliottia amnigena]QXB21777.1 hypothetical protein I6L76_22090 [Lelliottia amnigena]